VSTWKNNKSAFILIAISIFVSAGCIVLACFRNLSALENILFQVFSLGLGFAGSYILGQKSANDVAKEIIRPHVKAAFRRLNSLYSSLGRIISFIDSDTNSNDPSTTLKVVRESVFMQVSQADDAMEDWSDIIPEDVERLKERAHRKLQDESK
jgi:hypothetical protein